MDRKNECFVGHFFFVVSEFKFCSMILRKVECAKHYQRLNVNSSILYHFQILIHLCNVYADRIGTFSFIIFIVMSQCDGRIKSDSTNETHQPPSSSKIFDDKLLFFFF